MILQSYTAMIALKIFRPAINFDCFSHCCFRRCSFVDFFRSLALHPGLAEKCIDAVKQQCGELLEISCTLKKCPTVSSPRRHVNAFVNGHDLESRKNHLTIFVWCGPVYLFDQWIALRGGRLQSRPADSCSVSGPAPRCQHNVKKRRRGNNHSQVMYPLSMSSLPYDHRVMDRRSMALPDDNCVIVVDERVVWPSACLKTRDHASTRLSCPSGIPSHDISFLFYQIHPTRFSFHKNMDFWSELQHSYF